MDQHLKQLILSAIEQAVASGILVGAGPAAPYSTPTPWRDAKGIAEYVGMSTNWVRQNMAHLAHRPGGSDPRWHVEEVDTWIRSGQTRTDVSEETEPAIVALPLGKRARRNFS